MPRGFFALPLLCYWVFLPLKKWPMNEIKAKMSRM
jgi:hypothetical protein